MPSSNRSVSAANVVALTVLVNAPIFTLTIIGLRRSFYTHFLADIGFFVKFFLLINYLYSLHVIKIFSKILRRRHALLRGTSLPRPHRQGQQPRSQRRVQRHPQAWRGGAAEK